MANPGLFLLILAVSHHDSITNEKSVDVVLGIRTGAQKMVGADGSTEQWRPPYLLFCPIPKI